LLRDIRAAQQVLSDFVAPPSGASTTSAGSVEVTAFLESLSTAWKAGDVRATHRKSPSPQRWWRTRADPFEHAWGVVEGWLDDAPTSTAKELMERLSIMLADAYPTKAQLRTLQRRIKAWRAEKAKDLILGQMKRSALPSVAAR